MKLASVTNKFETSWAWQYLFKTESLGNGDYFGFEIDGDKRFMLGDFTVTHNTSTARLITPKDKFEKI